MATAPRPGAARKNAAKRKYLKIAVTPADGGDPVEAIVRPQDYGPRDETIVRMATRKPYNDAFPEKGGLGFELSLQGLIAQMTDGATVGMDTIGVLWWFGRYKAGDPVALGQALFVELPSMDEFGERVSIEEVDPDGDEKDLRPEE